MSPLTPPAIPASLPLVLGGHSFIHQLGTDPRPSEDTALKIVAACLEQGITWFDTTYQPERIALGRILKRLNAREHATILAWNFFQDFDDSGHVGGPSCYTPDSMDLMCRQLQTDVIDILVVHSMGNAEDDRRQEELALLWREQGRVRQLGVWHPDGNLTSGAYDFAIAPCNIADSGGERFPNYRTLGWETLATSPFVRGWLLERLAQRSGRPTEEIADLLLRYAGFHPSVDRLIVSIRKPAWVEKNVASWQRGPLSVEETGLLHELFVRFGSE